MQLVPQLTAFLQPQATKSLGEHSSSLPLGNTFGIRQLREQKVLVMPYNLHTSKPVIGGRQATLV